ncbi:NEDD4-binding protein 2-like 1 isoform X2 [Scleropages formosus]|uniref:NEDD4-binding protein 2-like 1 n=1 Tax=Scleropages formosus TaxID=113540 RepID=A0A8C9TZK3_SCLFO|nr:NEDD4-binding protein 2-like 1 isoform X2 [Scleropages formosus]
MTYGQRRFNRPHLYILRGLPGSGKSSFAKKIRARYGEGRILSSDDYFRNEQGVMVHFDRQKLPEAHRVNRRLAWEAMRDGVHPVIIDNTNITCRDMRSYVKMGLRFGYHIRFRYTRDSWRRTVEELHERINGKVPLWVMKRMKRRYEFISSIYDVLYGLCDS